MAHPHLPNEIILMIAQYLTPRGIATLMQCSRDFYNLLQGGLIYDRTRGASRNEILLNACQADREDIVHAMLQRHGEFGYRDWKGFELVAEEPTSELSLPLRFAAWYGHVGIIRILLDWNISIIQYDFRALPSAVMGGHLEAVKVLLEYLTKIPEDEPETLFEDEDFVEEVLDESPPVSVHEDEVPPAYTGRHGGFLNQALFEAVRSGCEDIVEVLLADGRARLTLSQAARMGSERFVKLCSLHERPNIVRPLERSPVVGAARAGHKGALQILFEAGWDTNLRDHFGETPLSAASAAGQVSIVKMLLGRKDVMPDTVSTTGYTPLLEASRHGHTAIITQLLRNPNVNVNAVNDAGESPLSFAAQRGDEIAARLLLSAGAHPDTRDARGRTPLSLAAGAGFPEVVRLLLATAGVDPDSKCQNGQTPLAYAVLSGHFPGRVNGSKTNPNDEQDEHDMLNVLQDGLEGSMACLNIESVAHRDGALSVIELLLATGRVDPQLSRLKRENSIVLGHLER